MAADWFPLCYWRSRTPEVVSIAASTGRSRQEVVGLLCDFWSWASEESADGTVRGVRLCHLSAVVGGDDRFWRAVVDANWLAEDDHGIVVPGWDNWLSESAKKRARAAIKKRIQRRKRPAPVPKVSPSGGDQSGDYSNSKQKTVNRRNKTDANASVCPDAGSAGSGPLVVSEPPVMEFPCTGTGPKVWVLTHAKFNEYRESFPGIDVLAECRKARQWLLDNPARGKTHRGMPKYLGGWLSRSQDSAKSTNLFRGDYQTEYAKRTLKGVLSNNAPQPEE